MKRAVVRWWNRPAMWWQFWRPLSGWRGGVIFGLVLAGAESFVSRFL